MTKKNKNPFKVTIDNSKYILGRFCKLESNRYKYFAVLISLEDGNRFIEPIEISNRKWSGLCLNDIISCKEIIQMIKDTAVLQRKSL